LLAAGDEDGAIKLWELPDGKEIGSFKTGTRLGIRSLAFGPDVRRRLNEKARPGRAGCWPRGDAGRRRLHLGPGRQKRYEASASAPPTMFTLWLSVPMA